MNYIEQINNFWAYTEDKELTAGDQSVYFALLKYNNALNWIKTFNCEYFIICQYSRVSKNTFYRSLDNLSDLKLITYEKGVRNLSKPKVSVLKLKNRKGIIKEQKGNNKGTKEEQNEEQKGNLYKLLNKETIKLINTKTKVFCDFVNNNLDLIFPEEKPSFEVSEFEKGLREYFSQTTDVLQMRLSSFLRSLKNKGDLENFEKQTIAYVSYKEKSEEKVHSWQGYQAEWKNTDWIDKLSKLKIKPKTLQYQQQTDVDRKYSTIPKI